MFWWGEVLSDPAVSAKRLWRHSNKEDGHCGSDSRCEGAALPSTSQESPEKGAVVVLPHRLGVYPQAAWLRRTNPAFKQLDAVVIKHTGLMSRTPLKAPFMGRSFVALAFPEHPIGTGIPDVTGADPFLQQTHGIANPSPHVHERHEKRMPIVVASVGNLWYNVPGHGSFRLVASVWAGGYAAHHLHSFGEFVHRDRAQTSAVAALCTAAAASNPDIVSQGARVGGDVTLTEREIVSAPTSTRPVGTGSDPDGGRPSHRSHSRPPDACRPTRR